MKASFCGPFFKYYLGEIHVTIYSEGMSFTIEEYPDYAKYAMVMPVLSRGDYYNYEYCVAPQEVSFSEFNKSIALHNMINSRTRNTKVFDTSLISDIIPVNNMY